MGDCFHGADVLAQQACYVTGPINGDGIKRADEPRFLGADCNTGTTIDAGIPADTEDDRLWFTHIFLYSELGSK